MRIRGIFCGTAARTNEEYKKVLKRRNGWLIVLIIMGIFIAAMALAAESSGTAVLPEYILGVYCGVGTGFVIAGIILFVRNLILMKDENKLKQSRLENSDERLLQIRNKASMIAIEIMLLVGTAGGMIAGIYEPILIKACLFMLDVFIISYIAAFVFYNRKM